MSEEVTEQADAVSTHWPLFVAVPGVTDIAAAREHSVFANGDVEAHTVTYILDAVAANLHAFADLAGWPFPPIWGYEVSAVLPAHLAGMTPATFGQFAESQKDALLRPEVWDGLSDAGKARLSQTVIELLFCPTAVPTAADKRVVRPDAWLDMTSEQELIESMHMALVFRNLAERRLQDIAARYPPAATAVIHGQRGVDKNG